MVKSFCFICCSSESELDTAAADLDSLSLLLLMDNAWISRQPRISANSEKLADWRQKLDSCPEFQICPPCREILRNFDNLLQQILALEAQVGRIREHVLEKLDETDVGRRGHRKQQEIRDELITTFRRSGRPQSPNSIDLNDLDLEIKTEIEDFEGGNSPEELPEPPQPPAEPLSTFAPFMARRSRDPFSAHAKLEHFKHLDQLLTSTFKKKPKPNKKDRANLQKKPESTKEDGETKDKASGSQRKVKDILPIRPPRVRARPDRKICEHCGKVLSSGFQLRAHIARMHTDASEPHLRRPFVCEVCSRGFADIRTLHRHRTTHPELNLVPFQCAVCNKKFSSPFYLRTHIKTVHEGAHRYECPEAGCGFKCWQPNKLEQHVSFRHRGERRYICAEGGCGAAFARKPDLELHMRSKHTGERPYACDKCSWRSASKKYLRVHLKTHEKK